MARVIILDVESTGVSKTDQVIELAYLICNNLELEKANKDDIEMVTESINNFRFFPSCSIHPRALEVHGITMKDLVHEPKSHFVNLPEDTQYIIGHNISFDKRLLLQSNPALADTLENAKYICTLALAKSISKFLNLPLEKHSLDYLAEYFYPEHKELLVLEKHTAKNDVLKTLLVLLKLVKHLPNLETYEDIYNFLETMKKVKK